MNKESQAYLERELNEIYNRRAKFHSLEEFEDILEKSILKSRKSKEKKL